MTEALPLPVARSVLHPTDFSDASHQAFVHALAFALVREARLTLIHVFEEGFGEDSWSRYPAVRSTLSEWGLLEEGSPRSAVFDELGVYVKKAALRGRDPVDAILRFMEDLPVDLIVLATSQDEASDLLPDWLTGAVAEPLARRAGVSTLFVPQGCAGFVSPATGKVVVRRILVPVCTDPSPRDALEVATRVARFAVADEPVEIVLFHVGDSDSAPEMELPEGPEFRWVRMLRQGELVDQILAACEEVEPDLVVMATAGRRGVLDALFGSTSEQVVARVPRPILTVPSAR